jgi:adenosylcobinamide kinase/adenosylcobinamide-phosphate guanylyltransferase
MILVTGGAKNGRSQIAESFLDIFPNNNKYYIATMQPYGEEALATIERHRKLRAEKAFQTIEKYRDINEIVLPEKCGVLLECVSTLLFNEMSVDKVINGIEHMKKLADVLIIVTIDVSCDGIEYDSSTAEYIKMLGEINQTLAETADTVIECVYGIPIVLKGGKLP